MSLRSKIAHNASRIRTYVKNDGTNQIVRAVQIQNGNGRIIRDFLGSLSKKVPPRSGTHGDYVIKSPTSRFIGILPEEEFKALYSAPLPLSPSSGAGEVPETLSADLVDLAEDLRLSAALRRVRDAQKYTDLVRISLEGAAAIGRRGERLLIDQMDRWQAAGTHNELSECDDALRSIVDDFQASARDMKTYMGRIANELQGIAGALRD